MDQYKPSHCRQQCFLEYDRRQDINERRMELFDVQRCGIKRENQSNANQRIKLSNVKTTETTTFTMEKIKEAKLKGYTGDICTNCGSPTMVRNGTCLKCITCGETSGCS